MDLDGSGVGGNDRGSAADEVAIRDLSQISQITNDKTLTAREFQAKLEIFTGGSFSTITRKIPFEGDLMKLLGFVKVFLTEVHSGSKLFGLFGLLVKSARGETMLVLYNYKEFKITVFTTNG